MEHQRIQFNSSLGMITVLAKDGHLTHLHLPEPKYPPNVQAADLDIDSPQCQPVLRDAREQLLEYLEGKRQQFKLPLAPEGTEFQKQVWQTLEAIPNGTTWSYQDLAKAIHNPKAVRAVGAANGRNPIAIIIPCHRVIGSNGKLTGYAGGMARKEWLLAHEARHYFSLRAS
ncbi:MAG: methylated-DNA--[protein]-cysteine S-methyltransferase [Deltaproteobacteria bacterium]|nr:MAG: methylated-DNA--[protein]-cysteine S-methyltransferase [Deltaproteobacteria bacterium]